MYLKKQGYDSGIARWMRYRGLDTGKGAELPWSQSHLSPQISTYSPTHKLSELCPIAFLWRRHYIRVLNKITGYWTLIHPPASPFLEVRGGTESSNPLITGSFSWQPAPTLRWGLNVTSVTWQKHFYSSYHLGNFKCFRSSVRNWDEDQVYISYCNSEYHTRPGSWSEVKSALRFGLQTVYSRLFLSPCRDREKTRSSSLLGSFGDKGCTISQCSPRTRLKPPTVLQLYRYYQGRVNCWSQFPSSLLELHVHPLLGSPISLPPEFGLGHVICFGQWA